MNKREQKRRARQSRKAHKAMSKAEVEAARPRRDPEDTFR